MSQESVKSELTNRAIQKAITRFQSEFDMLLAFNEEDRKAINERLARCLEISVSIEELKGMLNEDSN